MAKEGQSSQVTIIENEFIELKDGVKLSARIWLPAEASQTTQVPAVFEFLPYGKRASTTIRDEITYQHFAQSGYAGVRVDMRGCGDSTGYPVDEYVVEEQDDAIECIEWISKQPWCTGRVGMMGISWGGFNSLQVAARQPEALKAIISVCFTDDRYDVDIHYKGGCMLMDNVKWATYMGLMYSLPPDPLISNDWLKKWLHRLDQLPPAAEEWLKHQTRDDFWKHGSVCEDYTKIKVPSLLFSGYADGYTTTVKRTYDNIQCPKRGIVGPWVHLYPHISTPGPLWGYSSEAINWWDQWLKDIKPPREDKFIAYVQKNVDVPCPEHVDGKWIENPVSELTSLYLTEGKLGDKRGESVITICSSETCGRQWVTFFPVSLSDMPGEQSPDDKLSYVFDSEPVGSAIDYVGQPRVTLSVASDKPYSKIFLRLCVVTKDGVSRLIAMNSMNLNMSDDYEKVAAIESGVFREINVDLDFIGETVQPEDKLRLAVSSAAFPTFVPNREHTKLSLDLSGCRLDLPKLISSDPLSENIPELTECKPHPVAEIKSPSFSRNAEIDDLGGSVIHTVIDRGQKKILAHGLVTQRVTDYTESVGKDDPTTARLQVIEKANWSRGEDWRVEIRYTMDFTMDKQNFKTYETREVKHNDQTIFTREYNSCVPRAGQ